MRSCRGLHSMRWRTCDWASSKFLRTACLRVLLNANGPWRWIAIWPMHTLWIGLAKVYIGRAGETEADVQEALCLSSRDTRSYIWLMIVGMPSFTLAHMERRYFAYAVALRPIEIIRSRIFGWQLRWRGSMRSRRLSARRGRHSALNPSFSICRVRSHLPSDNPIYLAGRAVYLYEGLSLAGVPEQ